MSAIVALLLLLSGLFLDTEPAERIQRPFYAMDTGFRRPGLTTEQQLDLLKELGYAGIAWTEEAPEKVAQVAAQTRKRGLRMYAIYCGGSVNTAGELTLSKHLPGILQALAGQDTVIWLYLTGPGPKVATLQEGSPVLRQLRELTDQAAKHKLRVAVYPHAGFWIADTASALALARRVDRANFGIGYNLIHSLWAGEEKDIPQLIEQARAHLFTVTINGAEKTKNPGFRTPILTLDRGTFDVRVVLQALDRIDYRGPVGFQGYGIQGQSREILEPTLRAWKKVTGN